MKNRKSAIKTNTANDAARKPAPAEAIRDIEVAANPTDSTGVPDLLDLFEQKGLSKKPELAAKQKRLLDILRKQRAEQLESKPAPVETPTTKS